MESAALAEFEKEFSAKIAEKDEANKAKREEMKQEAVKELEKFTQEFKMKCEVSVVQFCKPSATLVTLSSHL